MPPPLLALELPAAPHGIARARSAVTQLCDALDVPAETRDDIRLAVTEACTNCVLHAYDGKAPISTYRVEAIREPGAIVVVVEDWGAGIDGDGDTELARREEGSHGRGLDVMRTLATSIEIRSAIGQGTRVELRFALP